jgi:hypothetical protein
MLFTKEVIIKEIHCMEDQSGIYMIVKDSNNDELPIITYNTSIERLKDKYGVDHHKYIRENNKKNFYKGNKIRIVIDLKNMYTWPYWNGDLSNFIETYLVKIVDSEIL